MSKSEILKEEIGWLKVVFGLLMVTDILLLAWIAQNFRKADFVLIVSGAIAAILISLGVVWINRIAYKK